MSGKRNCLRSIAAAALILYALALVYLMLLRRVPYPARAYNLVPLRTIGSMLRYLLDPAKGPAFMRRALAVNLAGNVAAFLPMGFLPPCVWRGLRRWRRTLPASAAVVVALELTQYFTRLGSADVDDLLLNLVGVALGYAVFTAASKLT